MHAPTAPCPHECSYIPLPPSHRTQVSLLAECEHPHILRFIDFYNESKYYYLITEVVSGGELFERIAEKDKYDEHEVRRSSGC
jgi:serine/threonine protein kinase